MQPLALHRKRLLVAALLGRGLGERADLWGLETGFDIQSQIWLRFDIRSSVLALDANSQPQALPLPAVGFRRVVGCGTLEAKFRCSLLPPCLHLPRTCKRVVKP